MKTEQKNTTWMPYGLIILQSLLYGFGDPISKDAYEVMPVYSLLSLRYLIALVILMLLFGRTVVKGLRQSSQKDWLLPSLCIGGSYVISNMALNLTAATSVAFLRSLATVMTPLLAMVVYRKKMGWKHLPIQILVVVGLYLLCGLGGLSGFGLGEILALAAALLMAGSLVFGEHALKHMDSPTLSAVQTGMSALMATVCAFAFGGGWHLELTTPKVWAIIFYLAAFCTMAGYLLQNKALTAISSRSVALLQCICPVLTAVFSRILLDEKLSTAGTAGAVLILVCVVAETLIQEE